MKLNNLLLPEAKKVFYGWLQQQGALNEYKKALEVWSAIHAREYDDGQVLSQFINASFTWSLTPQGHTYWARLHKKWVSYITGYIKTHSKFSKWASANQMRLHYA
jgi:hypothetical protein